MIFQGKKIIVIKCRNFVIEVKQTIFFCYDLLIFFDFFFIEKLMMSVSNGKEGFLYLSKVLEILLQTLLQDQISEVRKLRLRRVLSSEILLQTLLMDQIS